jgi:hypothetical protein
MPGAAATMAALTPMIVTNLLRIVPIHGFHSFLASFKALILYTLSPDKEITQ